jgi:iron-sulfur cluster assembly protein
MIHVSDAAAAQLRLLSAEQSPGSHLRLAVERGGCAGLSYLMAWDTPKDGDRCFGSEGAGVIVDPSSMEFVSGSTIDYCDDLAGAGFRILNPRATRSCGCGTSFEPEAAAEESTASHA